VHRPDQRKVVLVTRKTGLETLVARYHTAAQARFYIEHLGADFGDYEREAQAYADAKRAVLAVLERHERYQVVDRAFVPNFLFGPDDVVLALGQDGLVANVMKYLDGHPLVGINPEATRYDGVLLPFTPEDVAAVLADVLADRRPDRTVTMARASLSDGQSLLAVNDLFIGPKTHTSARYELWHGAAHEFQSSSGIIVSTGLGSTGWMKSVLAGAFGVAHAGAAGGAALHAPPGALAWDARVLRFAVREPFPSRTSHTDLVFGEIGTGAPLRVLSHMPENGVVFSDGMEADHLQFPAGTTAIVDLAPRTGRLIV